MEGPSACIAALFYEREQVSQPFSALTWQLQLVVSTQLLFFGFPLQPDASAGSHGQRNCVSHRRISSSFERQSAHLIASLDHFAFPP